MMQQLQHHPTEAAPRRKILIVTEHGLVRHGLQLMLSASTPHELAQDSRPLECVHDMVMEHGPDIVIADLSTRGDCFGEVGRAMADPQVRSQFLLICRPDDLPRVPLSAGAVVSATDAAITLLDALKGLAEGGRQRPAEPEVPRARDGIASPPQQDISVTPREREIIELITRGLCSKRIARELQISVSTVRTHRQRLMAKLGLHNSVEVARFAARVFGTPAGSDPARPVQRGAYA